MKQRPHELFEFRVIDYRINRAKRRLRYAMLRVRNWLRRPDLLSGHVSRRWHGSLNHRIERPTGLTIPDVGVARLTEAGDAPYRLAGGVDVEQQWACRGVVVPDVVVNRLVVPCERPGRDLQGNNRIGEEICTFSG